MSNSTDKQASFSLGRRWAIGFNVSISVMALLALVLMVNFLASRHSSRFMWSGQNPNQLSALTVQMLSNLTNQVKIVAFFDKQESLYSSVSSLLNEYQLACPRLNVEYVDYLRNPGSAQLMIERYKLAFPSEEYFKNLVIFDYNGRIKIVYEKEMSDMDISGPLSGTSKEIKRSNFKGELLFTSAIVSVTDARRLKAYFLEGHREANPQSDEPSGFSKLSQLLQQNNIQVELLSLAEQEVPTDCNLLLVVGPQQRFDPSELDRLDKYLSQGGRMFVCMNNLGRTGIEKLLETWGVRAGDNLVFDVPASSKGADVTLNPDLIVTNYVTPSHPIVKPLLRSRLRLVLPRAVEVAVTNKTAADAPKVEELASSGQEGIVVTDIRNGVPYPDLFRDRRGSIPVMAAVEKGTVQGIGADRGATRLVVVGDSIFLSNQLIDFLANRDLAVLAVNWLLDRSYLMGGIGPRPIREFHLVMSPAQLMMVRWVMLGALPGGVLILGGLVWWRRRH